MGGLLDWLGGFASWLGAAWTWIKQELGALASWALDHLKTLAGWIKDFPGKILAALKWLASIRPSDIWHWLQDAYNFVHKWIGYYRKYILGPMEKERQNIQRIYNTYFKPIIKVIDDFRVLTRIIGIFNKKLAAKLDQRLMSLESWILLPITDSLKRINQLSSWARAIVTELGFFDRETELESLRRDARLVWGVLTNPQQLSLTQAGTAAQPGSAEIVANLQTYLQQGEGPYLDSTTQFQEWYSEATADMGGL